MSATTKAALDEIIMRLVATIASQRERGPNNANIDKLERHLTALCDEANQYAEAR